MKRIDTTAELRALLHDWRMAGDRIALVPTMGNLHKGHMELVKLASRHAEHVVVSVFVNPTQFGPNEDFEDYPRTLDMDARRLAHADADVLFAPEVDEMYPFGAGHATVVEVPGLTGELEGASRPGHFTGVTSVVCRLLNICQPTLAVFGQKDYQQCVVIRRMIEDLQLPVEMLLGPTVRADNGLALSSRNAYLDDAEQERAGIIYQSLSEAAAELKSGQRDYPVLERTVARRIDKAGLSTDYIAVRRASDLGVPDDNAMNLVVLAAARLGKVRLIDNVLVDIPAA